MRSPLTHEPAFCGRILAGATHDLRNVMAVIKEYAGLLEDIVAAGPQTLADKHERVERILSSIAGQLSRGEALLGQLNRFAHCADEERGDIEAGEALELLSFLTRRHVNQAGVEQEVAAEAGAVLHCDVMRLLMALHGAQEATLAAVAGGGRLVLSARRDGQEVELELRPEGDGSGRAGDLDPVAEALEPLGGRVETGPDGSVRIRLPRGS